MRRSIVLSCCLASMALCFAELDRAFAQSRGNATSDPASSNGPQCLAAWDFNELEGRTCRDASGNGHHAEAAEPPRRVRGIQGQALQLAGGHRIQVKDGLSLDGRKALSFSAWTLPTDLSSYREIFRKEDGDRRVLFSYQDDGTVLSLGLNVGGYVECDARLDPAKVLDGRWHHCAATYDGQFMRVYFDGAEIGALKRPGLIDARGTAPAFIGSLAGKEPFQGLLDEVRIYADALSAKDIAALYEAGKKAAAEYPRDLVPGLAAAPAAGKRFAPALPASSRLVGLPAAAQLEEDWLFQAEGRPLAERAKFEVERARQLAERIAASAKDDRDLKADLAALDGLQQRLSAAATADEQAGRQAYLAARAIKRRIFLRHPALDFTRILMIDQPFPRGIEWDHQAKHRLGHMAVPGGKLLVLDGLGPHGKLRQLAPEAPAAFWRPDLSHDAQRVLFCMCLSAEKSFHLYEINLDGTGLRQLTKSLYDDLDPIYLPDGHILFTSTRGNTYIRCMPETYSYVLARCDSDGKNLYLVSRNSEADWLPALLQDGRVVYSRWEYSDKAVWRAQKLWTINQDGTGEAMFYGNQSVWPDHMAQPRAVPGTNRVMFVGVGHHNWFGGSIGVVDPAAGGNNYPFGLTRVTWELPWVEVGNGPSERRHASDYQTAGRFRAYQTPWPLSADLMLVSAQRAEGRGKNSVPFDLYLMDTAGNRELIHLAEHNIFHAMPVRPRSYPRQPDRVAWPGTGKDYKGTAPGVLYSSDVYQGVPDLPRGTVKYLRVVQQDQKTYSTWAPREAHGSHGPGVSAVLIDAVKRVLGTVPVADDGSVAFEVPAGEAVFFQLLDGQQRAVHTMRSFTGAMPGEVRGCVGCHESHSVAPTNPHGDGAYAVRSRKLVPPPWGTDVTVGYERFVQPVLDKHCGKCHQGAGEGRPKLDLTLRPGLGAFKEPYLTIVGPLATPWVRCNGLDLAAAIKAENFPTNGTPVPAYQTVRPLTRLSARSRLIDIAVGGKHHDVKIVGVELQQLIAWVDCNSPYRGDEEIRQIPDVPAARYGNVPIPPRTMTAPRIERFNIPQDD